LAECLLTASKQNPKPTKSFSSIVSLIEGAICPGGRRDLANPEEKGLSKGQEGASRKTFVAPQAAKTSWGGERLLKKWEEDPLVGTSDSGRVLKNFRQPGTRLTPPFGSVIGAEGARKGIGEERKTEQESCDVQMVTDRSVQKSKKRKMGFGELATRRNSIITKHSTQPEKKEGPGEETPG